MLFLREIYQHIMADEQGAPKFDFSKGVVGNEAKSFEALAASLKQTASPNPPAAIIPPVVTPPAPEPKVEAKKEEAPKEEEKKQVASEIELPEAIAEPKPKEKKGKKKEETKEELPNIVDSKGNKVELTSYSEQDRDSFLESIGIKPEPEVELGSKEKVVKDTKNNKKDAALPKDVVEKLSLLETENKQLKNDPAYNLAKELIGKDKDGIRELVKKFDFTDYKSLSPKDIYTLDLKEQGIEGEELESAIAEFEELPQYKQKLTTNPLRSKFQERADESLKIASNAPTEKQLKEYAKIQREAADNALASLDELTEKVATKGYYGWKPNEEDLNIIREGVLKNTIVSEDGRSYDVNKSWEQSVWGNPEIRNKIIKHSYEIGKFSGYEDFIKERIRVNPKDHIPGSQGGTPATYSFNKSVTPAPNGQNN